MADILTPTPPAPISGYRSRAINAAVAYTTATRPLAGDGVTIADGVGGKTISVEPRGFAQRAAPWQVRAYPEPTSGTAVDWKVRVYGGLAIVNGGELAAPSEDGTDEATGLKWYEAPSFESDAPWLCVQSDGNGSWFLSWKSSAVDLTDGEEYRAIAYLDDDGPPPRLIQFDVGVVDLGGGGGGFGPDTPSTDYVEVVLSGAYATADTATWDYGDTDPQTGKLTAPRFCPYRLYYDDTNHQMLQFQRTCKYNHNGALISVSAEVRTVVFTADAEMP